MIPAEIRCGCGESHPVVCSHFEPPEPMIVCPTAPPGTMHRLDTRYVLVGGERVFRDYAGVVWVCSPDWRTR